MARRAGLCSEACGKAFMQFLALRERLCVPSGGSDSIFQVDATLRGLATSSRSGTCRNRRATAVTVRDFRAWSLSLKERKRPAGPELASYLDRLVCQRHSFRWTLHSPTKDYYSQPRQNFRNPYIRLSDFISTTRMHRRECKIPKPSPPPQTIGQHRAARSCRIFFWLPRGWPPANLISKGQARGEGPEKTPT